MADRSFVMKIGVLIVLACSIGLTTATRTLGVDASSVGVAGRDTVSSPRRDDPSQGGGLEAGSLANVAELAKRAVISVRAKHSAQAVEPGVGAPSDHVADPLGGPHGRSSPGRRRAGISQGSGFFISADGYAVTNNHVTEVSESVEIVTDDDKTYKAKVVGADSATDMTLLKVDGRTDFAYVRFADKAARVGDRIFAVGNPFGLGGTVTAGIVSARERSLKSDERAAGANMYEDLIQIDAAINRGNSGGPSFDMEGNVIGVNTVILSPTGGSIGIGFAIPAEIAKTVIAQLMETGSVTRGWIGVQFQSLTPAIGDALGLKEARGALVAEPLSDGPAKEAGIAPGDVIDSIDGAAVKDSRDLSRKMIGLAPGVSIRVGVIHDREERSAAITLGELPATKEMLARGSHHAAQTATPAVAPPSASDLGLKLAPAVEMPGAGGRGVIVIGIDPNGRAADLGVEVGDIILEVSGKAVQTADDIRTALIDARETGRQAALMRLKSGDAIRFVAVPLDPA